MTLTLYDRVFRGGVFYLHSIVYNVLHRQLSINYYGNPEIDVIVRVLTFHAIRSYTEEWFEEPDELYIDQMVGLDEYPQGETTRYVLHTSKCEVIFTTAVAPHIEEPSMLGQ